MRHPIAGVTVVYINDNSGITCDISTGVTVAHVNDSIGVIRDSPTVLI